MEVQIERAVELVDSYDEELRHERPADAPIFDANTHLGTDIDGMVAKMEKEYGLVLPLGELAESDPYAALTQGVAPSTSATRVPDGLTE